MICGSLLTECRPPITRLAALVAISILWLPPTVTSWVFTGRHRRETIAPRPSAMRFCPSFLSWVNDRIAPTMSSGAEAGRW